ncbi:hypothetical protein E2C01_054644 [Portunus trituberculatus]|uniref:Uncharacterized protein n=1 Tax=Portunus trituberculatus TaxID=210409 RepID=A0A5B7GP71_PORTR|nr:hypothetical protein [Portunus trituberculatus]
MRETKDTGVVSCQSPHNTSSLSCKKNDNTSLNSPRHPRIHSPLHLSFTALSLPLLSSLSINQINTTPLCFTLSRLVITVYPESP